MIAFLQKHAVSNLYKLFLLTAIMLVMGACTPGRYNSPRTSEDARLSWQNFVNKSRETETKPFRISANIRYATETEKTRVGAIIWGNNVQEENSPIRLDLLAGFGNVVGKVREDADLLLAFNPKTQVAYFHEHEYSTLASFGVPVPLSLKDLSTLLAGQSGALFLPPDNEKFPPMPKEYIHTRNGTEFEISDCLLPGILELSPEGFPISWRESSKNGWVIQMTPRNDGSLIPQQLYIFNRKLDKKNYNATITLKEITNLDKDYTKEQLELALPQSTVFQKITK